MDYYTTLDTRIEAVFVGSAYGGWTLRIEELESTSVVYSVGVGKDISFDVDLINRCGCIVHAFDPTPGCISWISEQELPPSLVFHPVGLAHFDGVLQFSPPEDRSHVSYSALGASGPNAIECRVERLSTCMARLGHGSIDVLKMDIEGSEYDVIQDILNSGITPRQLLVEFHHGSHSIDVRKTQEAVSALRKAGFQLYNVSSRGKEYSFIYPRLHDFKI